MVLYLQTVRLQLNTNDNSILSTMKTGIKTIDNLPKKHTHKINDVSDERKMTDGLIWIYLKKGYCNEGSDGEHAVRERTVTDVAKALRNTSKCHCKDCTEETGYWN